MGITSKLIPLDKLKRVLFIALLVVFGCEDKDKTSNVIYSSIEDGDNISTNGGLIIQFSESMDLNIFEADAIITSNYVDIVDIDENYEGNYSDEVDTLPLPIFKIQNSNYIRLNHEPQTFYYDPTTFTCAFIRITNESYPDGTGEGFNIQEGNNEFIIGDLYSLNFYGINSYEIKAVPNPFLQSYHLEQNAMAVRFTNLPQYCVINILTSTGELVKTWERENLYDSHEWWNLKNEDGEDIVSGIYRYEVVYESFSFTNGVMVFERLQIDSSE